MINTKHTIAGFLAIALIGTMSIKQANDFRTSNRLAALLSSNTELTASTDAQTINISPKECKISDAFSEEELKSIIERKSSLQDSYVYLTFGTLSVYDTPSEEGNIIDNLSQCQTVKIIESTDGWYKITYDIGKFGYVMKEFITDNKESAEYAAMHYDNYKRGKIKTSGGDVNVRKSAASNGTIIGQLKNGSDIVIAKNESGYTKVYFGSCMTPGYVSSDCIELTGTWISKSEVTAIQKTKSKNTTYETPAKNLKGQDIVDQAKKYLGVKYVYGGSSPKGFDCSGLVQYVCKSLGVKVNRTAASQFNNGKAVNKKDLQPGDLLFFAKNGRIHHVGIYAGNGEMIHAPQSGDVVKFSSINTAYRQNEYVGARRVY